MLDVDDLQRVLLEALIRCLLAYDELISRTKVNHIEVPLIEGDLPYIPV